MKNINVDCSNKDGQIKDLSFNEVVIIGIIITPTSAEVPMDSLIDHTIRRTVEAYSEEITKKCARYGKEINATFYFTAGQDGSSHQNRFNQRMDENADDSSIFVVSVNPICLVGEDGNILYLNPTPQSPRSVRPQRIFFGKEDATANKREHAKATSALDELKLKEFKITLPTGNGPSGISLSFFLAGNFPYWKREDISTHPDELLRARLNFLDDEKSLIEHDLHALAQGLEGRTTNPVSLLFDNLQHPGADLGLKLPCMLKYKHHKDKEIDHIVLGKGKPGGSWHRMEPNLRTLSLSTWMSLPNLNFDDWLRQRETKCQSDVDDDAKKHISSSHNNLTTDGVDNGKRSRRKMHSMSEGIAVSEEVKTRALVHHVAEYYADYVHLMKLTKFFRNDTIVVSVRHVKESEKSKFFNARFIVHGFDRVSKKPFLIACNKVVMANGGSDLVNRLGVKGESKSLPWLKYELPLLESAIYDIKDDERKPVMIVGAGLSAADAIIACRNSGLEVIHVFRGVAAGFMGLPEAYFPEYNMVYRMMRNAREKYDLYQAVPESTLKEIKTVGNRHIVTILRNNHEELTFEVSHCAILIGSRPDLSSLSNISNSALNHQQHVNNINNTNNHNEIVTENFVIRGLRRLKIFCEKCRHLNLCFGSRNRNNNNNNLLNSLIEETTLIKSKEQQCECEEFVKRQVNDSGIGYGEDPKRPVDCKNNPIAVNKFTNEFLNVPGIFALGPLVGDNFVRFIAGGALSISSYLMRN